MAASIDPSACYELAPDLLIIQRDNATVQVGTDEPRRVLIADAPAGTRDFLATLGPGVEVAEAATRAGGDPERWLLIAEQLAERGLLGPARTAHSDAVRLTGEGLLLAHRYGTDMTDRILTARSDALVIVEGETAVADMVTDLLTALGVGHVHQQPGGITDLPAGVDRSARWKPPRTELSWQAPAEVRMHRPAPQVRPTVVVLAQAGPPDPGRAAELVTMMVPHLPVQVVPARMVVGPLVLPGRSACLNCLERYRIDADPAWPMVRAAMWARPLPPSPLLAHAAADLAVSQVLEWIDGAKQPETVSATLERTADSPHPQRRAWAAHPDCTCARIAHGAVR